ncbi:hypothetical protein ACUYFE_08010 [Olegusella massiliensis]|uniref:hypothetical protein n=1 Tax=Olegusella massiliensis TaxID=1776381 RepID=UPI00405537D2
MVDLNSYASAQEFFEAVKDASKDADRIAKILQTMTAAEAVKAQSYAPRITGGGNRDVMCATDKRMDYEKRIRARQSDDYELIDSACEVIYGAEQNGAGGVGVLLNDNAYADLLWWRYCAAASWPETAAGCGKSEKWCQYSIKVAFDMIDSYGLERVKYGLGFAEE